MERRERLRKLALETVDLNKDPYFLRNHLGTYVSASLRECLPPLLDAGASCLEGPGVLA